MARRKKATTKLCAMTGMTFPTTEFYANNTSKDGLHAYSKKLITSDVDYKLRELQ